MADGGKNTSLLIGEDLYRVNHTRIEEARAYIDAWSAMNEEGRKQYDLMQSELEKKIREGEDAKRLLERMQQAATNQPLAIEAPPQTRPPPVPYTHTSPIVPGPAPAARIEEVSVPPTPQSHWTPSYEHVSGGSVNPTAYNQYWNAHYSTNAHQSGQPLGSHQRRLQNQYSALLNQQSYPPQIQPYNEYFPQTHPQYPFQQHANQRVAPSVAPRQAHPQRQVQPSQFQSHRFMHGAGTPSTQQKHRDSQRSQQQQPVTAQLPMQPQHIPQNETPQSGPGPTPPIISDASVPHRSRAQQQQPIAVASSSSLAGALGVPQKAPQNTVNPQNVSRSTGATQNPVQHQAPSASASTSKMQHSAQTGGSGTVASATAGLLSDVRRPDLSTLIPIRAMVAKWEPTAPPHSFFDLPQSTIKVYKDKSSKVHLVMPDGKGGYTYIPASTLITKDKEPITQAAPANPPVSTESAAQYRPYGDQSQFSQVRPNPLAPSPPQPPSTGSTSQPQLPIAKPPPLNPPDTSRSILAEKQPLSSAGTPNHFVAPRPLDQKVESVRTPSLADKKHLARDILRALKPVGQKRPRYENAPTVMQEPPAKRHSMGLAGSTLDTAVPNLIVPPRPLSMQNVQTISSVPPTLPGAGPRLPEPPVGGLPTTIVQASPPVHVQHTVDIHDAAVSQMTSTNIQPLQPSTPASVPDPILPPLASPNTAGTALPSPPPEPVNSQPQPNDEQQVHAITSSSKVQLFERGSLSEGPERFPGDKIPLFLPSLSSSPSSQGINDRNDTFDLATPEDISSANNNKIAILQEALRSKKLGTTRTTRQPFYILIPPLPNYVKRFKAKQGGGAVSSASTSSERVGSNSDVNGDTWNVDDQATPYDLYGSGFAYDEAEREAAQLSCSRLSERPCKWAGCEAVMNSAENLTGHLTREHGPSPSQKYMSCQWPQCGRRFISKTEIFSHLRSHAQIPLICAYKGCKESFRTARQLAKHHESEHQNQQLKKSAALSLPKLGQLPSAPKSLPSYMVEARNVRQPTISKERHAVMGPWVLRNISGPVDLKAKRYNAAKPLRSQNRETTERGPGAHPYDFMSFSTTHFSTTTSQPVKLSRIDDLDSVAVSELVNDGMVLWQAPVVKHEERGESISKLSKSTKADDMDLIGGAPRDGTTQSSHSDEELVESMLAV